MQNRQDFQLPIAILTTGNENAKRDLRFPRRFVTFGQKCRLSPTINQEKALRKILGHSSVRRVKWRTEEQENGVSGEGMGHQSAEGEAITVVRHVATVIPAKAGIQVACVSSAHQATTVIPAKAGIQVACVSSAHQATTVIPAKAGIQVACVSSAHRTWVPACAGTTANRAATVNRSDTPPPPPAARRRRNRAPPARRPVRSCRGRRTSLPSRSRGRPPGPAACRSWPAVRRRRAGRD